MSPEDSSRKGGLPTNTGQTERIRNQEMVTLSVITDRLPRYYEAAKLSGFEVLVIAEPGQRYVTYAGHKLVKGDTGSRETREKPENITTISPPVRVGNLGISIEKPPESQDYGFFWDVFSSLVPPTSDSQN